MKLHEESESKVYLSLERIISERLPRLSTIITPLHESQVIICGPRGSAVATTFVCLIRTMALIG